ncbi:hypothetical protein CAGGBEG34_200124 [Candidatus Glomeribacter gigasporarum BEG34]|uniref:Uncharacterized protein n=1 Tax=Candidatus Glomeribacter gigasporarum BEG34 TaxID=1070319 RepID=G2J8M3_9BURK|nr:hypothetical protein [Candidatus Glomeribacter gigasporarum]CCD29120.1 hypothetical protein CAGGBEG34_200124 [Candidatus Glomeribacter gigasporarum BEG34]
MLPTVSNANTDVTPREYGVIQTLASSAGEYADSVIIDSLNKITGCVFGGTRVETSVKNLVNNHYITVDAQDAYLLARIRNLDAQMNELFSTFGIDPEQDVKQQAQKIASQLSPGACAEVLENCLKFLGDIRFSAENSKAVNDSSADHLSAHSDCSATQSVPGHIPLASATPSLDVHESQEIEEDPRISARIEELRVLLDILHAVCFNDFSKMEEKHWTRLTALLKPQPAVQPALEEEKGESSGKKPEYAVEIA